VSRRAAAEAAAVAYALVDVAVIMAPALVLSSSSYRSGVSGTPGLDLVLASAVVGAGHAVVAWARLRAEVRVAARRLDVWIASIDALVVLAVGVTLLMVMILEGFAGEHALLINEGWPVLGLWLGVLLLAVGVSELTGRLLFRWLERSTSVVRVTGDGAHFVGGRPRISGHGGSTQG
jgi:hypothetical protein